jgi:hypothetical protein
MAAETALLLKYFLDEWQNTFWRYADEPFRNIAGSLL